ncbi:LamG domain-containing protein [Nocardioides sp. MAHUQ-72]|uniref:LamG domain-containing protein n=1 Tax=unclassified Nocardioides TaxID=2615069 RepID=UPI003614F5C1
MRTSLAVSVVAALVAALAPACTSYAAPADVAAAPTTTGLVLNYGFDADTGTVARDSSPNAVNGTYVNTTAEAARSTGVPGRSWAITLVGAEHQYVAVPERNVLDVSRFTVAALVNYTGVQNDRTNERWEVVEKAGAYWINVRTDGHVRVGGFFGGCSSAAWKYLDSTVVVPTDTWTHVASTYNGSRLTVWINGTRAGSRAVTGTTCHNNRPLAVGAKNYPAAGPPEAFWDGRLDDVRIYGRALSATEIRGLLPG